MYYGSYWGYSPYHSGFGFGPYSSGFSNYQGYTSYSGINSFQSQISNQNIANTGFMSGVTQTSSPVMIS